MQEKRTFTLVQVIGICLITILIMCIPLMLECRHTEIKTVITQYATCTINGSEDIICNKCEKVLDTNSIPSKGHNMGPFIENEQPTENKNGVEISTCTICNFQEEREFKCYHPETIADEIYAPSCGKVGIEEHVCILCGDMLYKPIDKTTHEETKIQIIKEPTCYEEGIKAPVCVVCEAITEKIPIPMIECTWKEWEYSEYATPFEPGKRHHTCEVCNKTEDEEYEIELKENYIYIPSAGINAKFRLTSFTQSAVDGNDIVYTNKAYSVYDDTNPFVLGHWYGSLKDLWKTKVGTKIYINVENRIDVYEVINSEYAVQYNMLYHIGVETNVNIWDSYGSAMKSQYTNFGSNHTGKDLWPNINDGKTLHIYTCHYGKSKLNWNPSDGRNGRWIVLANLVDSQSIE